MHAFLVQHDQHFDITWNLDASVGRGGQNSNRTDVSFVQWYYTLAAESALTPQDRREIYRAVKVTGSCRGTDDDPLVRAILAHQRALNHPVVDGRVSVARPGVKVGENAFFILRLCARYAHMFPQQYPRLDLVNGCPSLVAEAIRASVPVIPGAS